MTARTRTRNTVARAANVQPARPGRLLVDLEAIAAAVVTADPADPATLDDEAPDIDDDGDDEDGHDGAMIALVPENPETLAVVGGEPADILHTTLVYLGDADDWTPAARDALEAAILDLSLNRPLEGSVFGHASFNPDDEQCAVHLVEAAGLSDLQTMCRDTALEVVDRIGDPELEIPEPYDTYIPHITAGYGMDPATLEYTGPVRFRTLRLSWADTDVRDISLEPLADAITAAGIVYAWDDFHQPEPGQPQPFTVHDDGTVSGHVATWKFNADVSPVARRVGVCPESPTPQSPASTAHANLIGEGPQPGSYAVPASINDAGRACPCLTSSAQTAGRSSSPAADTETSSDVTHANTNGICNCATREAESGVPPILSSATAPTGIGPDTGALTKGSERHIRPDIERASATSTANSPLGNSKRSSTPRGGAAQSANNQSSFARDNSTPRGPHTSTTTMTPARSADGSAPPATGVSEHSTTVSNSSLMPPGISVSGLMASSYPTTPPVEWFSDPRLDGPTPLVVDDDGRVYGHLASFKQCHTGYPDTCVTAPKSLSGYAYFHVGSVRCGDGSDVPVGRITMGTGHASTERGISAQAAAAHYDNTGTCVADVACGEDAHGIWVAGALRPDTTESQVRVLRASPLSGDWRVVNGNYELLAALAVNVPGFPIPHPVAASGALVAAGVVARREAHTGFAQQCVTPPPSAFGYNNFHQGGPIPTDQGPLRVGKVTFNTGHADPTQRGVAAAVHHYDHTGTTGALVRCVDGVHGPWMSGRLLPGLSDAQVEILRASAVSGDWRAVRSSAGSAPSLELVAVLSVNSPGFPIPGSHSDYGLAASGAPIVGPGALITPPVLADVVARESIVASAMETVRAARVAAAQRRCAPALQASAAHRESLVAAATNRVRSARVAAAGARMHATGQRLAASAAGREPFPTEEDDLDAIIAAESPRRDPFIQYWTAGEGLARWASSPKPYTTLVAQLREHMNERHAKGLAAKYFHRVFKMWPGDRRRREGTTVGGLDALSADGRKVRTPAGAKRYGLPINSTIGARPATPGGKSAPKGSTAPALTRAEQAEVRREADYYRTEAETFRRHGSPKTADLYDREADRAESKLGPSKDSAASKPAAATPASSRVSKKEQEELRRSVAFYRAEATRLRAQGNTKQADLNDREADRAEAKLSPGGGSAAAPTPPKTEVAEVRTSSPEASVISAYEEVAREPGSAVWLSDLREVSGLSRPDFDRVIVEMSRRPDVEVLPEENRKAIPQHARDGAVPIGGQASHHIRIRPRPIQSSAGSLVVDEPGPGEVLPAAGVQIHTAESLNAAEINHALYNESRHQDTTPERRRELAEQMGVNFRDIPVPPGTEIR